MSDVVSWNYYNNSKYSNNLSEQHVYNVRLLHKHAPSFGVIVDIGAGNGSFLDVAQDYFVNAVGTDITKSDDKRIILTRPWEHFFREASVDAVHINHVLEHLTYSEAKATIDRIHYILRDGGVCLASVPLMENLSDNTFCCPNCGYIGHRWGHKQAFSMGSLAYLFSDRFNILETRTLLFDSPSASDTGRLINKLKRIKLLMGKSVSGAVATVVARKW